VDLRGRKVISVGPAHSINGCITTCKSELELGVFVSNDRRNSLCNMQRSNCIDQMMVKFKYKP